MRNIEKQWIEKKWSFLKIRKINRKIEIEQLFFLNYNKHGFFFFHESMKKFNFSNYDKIVLKINPLRKIKNLEYFLKF